MYGCQNFYFILHVHGHIWFYRRPYAAVVAHPCCRFFYKLGTPFHSILANHLGHKLMYYIIGAIVHWPLTYMAFRNLF